MPKKKPDKLTLKMLDKTVSKYPGIVYYRKIPIQNFKKKDLLKICTIFCSKYMEKKDASTT